MKTMKTMKQLFKFSPWWLTGFTQADGSFMVIIKKQPRGKFLYRFVPTFELSQSIHDLELMQALHTYLGVGRLVINRERVSIVVTSLKEIITVILPHFEKYRVESLYLI
ncbi:probable LAGLIDADG endonuclease (mitochondrion) [Ustilago bromivora]|uniref:Probable LAGLIDADG endonuclease n=1 Tax=Ustilago bromivora TaxID=307758 RepID=A0A1K0GEQ0_9BASI|nr:probable LAGLIDADG endonuclease [Ustilago bromivora]